MRKGLAALFVAGLVAGSACGGGGGDGDSDSAPAKRPSSPAKVSIIAPINGEVVKGPSVEMKMKLEGGKIVEPSVTEITPTTGHIHVLLDGKVISMDYGLTQTLDELTPGLHTLRAEFVAADHNPFDPRVFDEIAFTDK